MGRRAIAGTAAVLGMLALAGCTSNPVAPVERPAASATPVASENPSTAPSEAPQPTPSATATGPTTIRVTQTCDELVPAQALYDFNPNYSADPNYAPSPDSDEALIVSYQGVACGWVNQSSGAKIEIAVAHLGSSDIEKIKNALVLSTPSVPTYGGVDYFDTKDGIGTANVFSGDYWIVARSTDFFEPGDAQSLIASVKAALG